MVKIFNWEMAKFHLENKTGHTIYSATTNTEQTLEDIVAYEKITNRDYLYYFTGSGSGKKWFRYAELDLFKTVNSERDFLSTGYNWVISKLNRKFYDLEDSTSRKIARLTVDKEDSLYRQEQYANVIRNTAEAFIKECPEEILKVLKSEFNDCSISPKVNFLVFPVSDSAKYIADQIKEWNEITTYSSVHEGWYAMWNTPD